MGKQVFSLRMFINCQSEGKMKEFIHNTIGHPLLAICNAVGAYRLGTFIHDRIFKF